MASSYKYFYCLMRKGTGEQASKLTASYNTAEKMAFSAKSIYSVACIAMLGDEVQIPPGFIWNPRYLSDAEKIKFNVK